MFLIEFLNRKWQIIRVERVRGEGQSGSGGRIRALEFLNSRPLRFPWVWGTTDLLWNGKECRTKLVFGRRWKREPLAGLSVPKAYLADIVLCDAFLRGANLQDANLVGANLQDAFLRGANLQDANLVGANLQDADLWGVNLQDANLIQANLQDAFLWEANLQDANLMWANLQDADLWGVNLQDANLIRANFQDADLRETILTNKQIKLACFWDKAIYKAQDNEERRTRVVESANNNFIEELKKDTASDPDEPPNCSYWENQK